VVLKAGSRDVDVRKMPGRPRSFGVLVVAVGTCLLAAALGLTVVQPSGKRLALETSTPPAPTTAPTTAAPLPSSTTTPPSSTTPPTPAPTTSPPPVTRAPARAPVAPIAAAPGVDITPPTTAAPGSNAPAPAVGPAGDAISHSGSTTPSTTVTTGVGPSTSYAFLDYWAPDKPTRWNPCTTIHYAVNAAEAPAGALTTVQQAITRLSSATGITFVFDGTTSEIPTSAWGYGPSPSFPSGWQPLLIGFVHDAESDLLEGDNAGTGYPETVEFKNTGERVDVSGTVAIDADQMTGLPTGFGGVSIGSVVLHELGHALGLAHVPDQTQIMNPIVGPWTPSQWGPGDLEGFRRIGTQAGCTRSVPPPPWG
jgi:hypothetical protein